MTSCGEITKVKEEVINTNLNCIQKCQKWDRRLASIFGLLAFATLLTIVIYQLTTSEEAISTRERVKLMNGVSKTSANCDTKVKGTITCTQVHEHVDGPITNLINKVLPTITSVSWKLRILSSTFNNSKLSKGWLSKIDNISKPMSSLELYSCTGTQLLERAFSGYPFENLQTLLITESGLTTLEKKSFLDLNSVTRFEFTNNNKKKLTVEKEFFEGMPNLDTISYSNVNIDKTSLSNSFGCNGASLTGLLNLALSNNYIEEINECSLTKAQNVQRLSLSSSHLKEIHKDAFKGKSKLKFLELKNNDLVTLENGTFENLQFTSNSLYLNDNNWSCNCELQWLNDYYFKTAYVNRESPPKCNKTLKFEEVDFCTEQSSPVLPPTSSSAPTTTTHSPTQEPKFMIINCLVHEETEELPKEAEFIVVHSVTVKIKEEFVDLYFQEFDSGGDLKVKVVTNATLELYHLVWFNSNNKSEYGCDSPLYDGLILDRLNRNTTYTFSVLENDKSEVSPKSTFGIKTEPDWKDRIWISNKHQILIISLTAISGLLFTFLTAFTTYLCIRRNPEIISGNKSVIIVKSKKASEVSHYPKEYEKPPYWDPYLVPASQGYLTPKLHRYSKVRYRPPLMRSMSEYSMGNASAAYADPKQLYDLKLLRSRMQANSQSDDFTPPLPPPNLKFQQQHSPIEEDELYSSI